MHSGESPSLPLEIFRGVAISEQRQAPLMSCESSNDAFLLSLFEACIQ